MSNTFIFNFISKYGRKIAKRRAMEANPDFADRERRRIEGGSNNTHLMSDGDPNSDISVNSFFEDMRMQHNYDPWWYKITLRIHWWILKWGPRATWRNLRAFYQRGRRGWADSDAWNLDHHLSKIIRDSIKHLNDNKHGHPGTVSHEEWTLILSEIEEGMDAYLGYRDDLDTDHEKSKVQFERAMEHLTAYWGHLWN